MHGCEALWPFSTHFCQLAGELAGGFHFRVCGWGMPCNNPVDMESIVVQVNVFSFVHIEYCCRFRQNDTPDMADAMVFAGTS